MNSLHPLMAWTFVVLLVIAVAAASVLGEWLIARAAVRSTRRGRVTADECSYGADR